MTSERKIAANRRNARKSRGPRTAAGKVSASRNALRHGLAAITHRPSLSSIESERFAKALCGDDENPVLFAQALVIANNEFVRRAINAQQIAMFERLREPLASALANDKYGLAQGKAKALKTRLAYDELGVLRDKLLVEHKEELPEFPDPQTEQIGFVPLNLLVLAHVKEDELTSPTPNRSKADIDQLGHFIEERDEGSALEAAMVDLVRLERYARRLWSQQKHAVHTFMQIKFNRPRPYRLKWRLGSEFHAPPTH